MLTHHTLLHQHNYTGATLECSKRSRPSCCVYLASLPLPGSPPQHASKARIEAFFHSPTIINTPCPVVMARGKLLPTKSSRPSAPPGPLRPHVMNIEEAFQAMQLKLPRGAFDFLAFYSSILGGIVTDPALMTVPMDEHMVHRGHAVFDTCNVSQGQCYGLDFHLDRLLRSAGLARIHPSYTKEELRHIILSTVAVSQQRDGIFVRFWMTAGRGNFFVSSKETTSSGFFVMVHHYTSKAEQKLQGVAEYVVEDIPLKNKLLATIKSTNYLTNALVCESAEDMGGFLGIQLDESGRLAESSIGNVAILTPQGILRTPPFENILAGTTVKRLWELAEEKLKPQGVVMAVEYKHITLPELLSATEAYSLGGGSVLPIVRINGKLIGDGKPGPVFKELDALLLRDMKTNFLDAVPYQHYAPGGWLKRGVRALRERWRRTDGYLVAMVLVALPLTFAMGKIRGGPTFVL